MNKSEIQESVRRLLDPLTRLLHRLGFSPNHLTVLGMFLCFLAAWVLSSGRLVTAGILLVIGSLFDVLDGGVARLSNRCTVRGAFLDSTLDRLAEIAVFIGFLIHFSGDLGMQIWAILALTGSLMTSYARARAEGLGLEAKVGLLERPERLVLIILGLLLSPLSVFGRPLPELVVIILALLSYVTMAQRIIHVLSHTPADESETSDQHADEDALGASGRKS